MNNIIDTATSYSLYKDKVKEYLKSKFGENSTILDVGAGSGTYYNVLGDFYKNMDAVEIFKPNIDNLYKHNLKREENSMTFVPTYLKRTEAEEKLNDNRD